jgi:hypothetical protein
VPIRYLATELYRLTQKVEELERRLAALGSAPTPERGPLEIELLQAKKERNHLRDVLESKKDKPLV